tara:strand:- start:648 stop:1124 length:477 start_codon:yes stop_codon:yes gene_type:complete
MALGTLKVDCIKSKDQYPVRIQQANGDIVGVMAGAWINVNTVASPIVINDGFNIAAVTEYGSADIVVSFENPFSHDGYAVAGGAQASGNHATPMVGFSSSGLLGNKSDQMTASSCRIITTFSNENDDYPAVIEENSLSVIFIGDEGRSTIQVESNLTS